MSPLAVLFIDDSDLDVMLAVRVLRGAGYEVRYERVERAADLAARLPGGWDLIVCDHQMPEFDALSALRMHREHGEDIPFLIVSGAMPDDLAIDAMREGARDFIHKDDLSRLLPAIERELRDARNRLLLRQTQDSVDRLLNFDQLTGLGNIDGLMHRLGLEIERGQAFALLIVDLDRFRKLMQRLGVVAANRILRVAAMRLEGVVDAQGFAARIGTDRFALICPGLGSAEAATEFGRRLHEELQAPMRLDDEGFVVSAGVGAALFPAHGQRAGALLRAAEAALEDAKRSGLRQVSIYDPAMALRERDSLIRERALRRAVAGKEFALHFQPRIDLLSGRPVGVEALLRWQSPERGLAPPNDFLSSLEDSGLILGVGEWVLDTAARQLKAWREQGLAVGRMAINLSPVEFQAADFAARVARQLERAGVLPGDIEFEITERLAMGNEEATIATLAALRALGVRLVIDNFGIGYSSLAYLQHFPVHGLKIDRSFLRGDHEDAGFRMARAVVAMGGHLGFEVAACGVETPAQRAALADAGCKVAQGYHFARPLAAEACAALLRQWRPEA